MAKKMVNFSCTPHQWPSFLFLSSHKESCTGPTFQLVKICISDSLLQRSSPKLASPFTTHSALSQARQSGLAPKALVEFEDLLSQVGWRLCSCRNWSQWPTVNPSHFWVELVVAIYTTVSTCKTRRSGIIVPFEVVPLTEEPFSHDHPQKGQCLPFLFLHLPPIIETHIWMRNMLGFQVETSDPLPFWEPLV